MPSTFETSRDLPHAPSEVFAAFAAPERLARWWGPAGFRNSFEVCEFRPGGPWRFTMHGPDGSDYPNEARFEEIVRERKIVIRHTCAPLFTLGIVLTPISTGTRLLWSQVFDDAAFAEAVRHIVLPANEQNLDRLTTELRTPGPITAG
ncbi:uncharacterized protein YndB with AHSA1/START domain [Paucibacter oligotrophus]|uniref:Uncharacterized protein YndB with AHSA1/START domain n=1 Tax=Roseateles oligotrophus TaxID=1769250 RepID=A0A840L4J5_9BURK|nr:SRPBCC domain-containing protein [Roseateles oligotrophus]MBB4843464.1 uncharacterized protein YndB with AHSA1/START domain [Roseateles oligotrophus]